MTPTVVSPSSASGSSKRPSGQLPGGQPKVAQAQINFDKELGIADLLIAVQAEFRFSSPGTTVQENTSSIAQPNTGDRIDFIRICGPLTIASGTSIQLNGSWDQHPKYAEPLSSALSLGAGESIVAAMVPKQNNTYALVQLVAPEQTLGPLFETLPKGTVSR